MASVAAAEARTERLPEEQLLDVLFGAFEKYQYWTFRSLVQYTHQPQNYLKEILGKVADQANAGPYKHHYHLKEQYSDERFSQAQISAPAEGFK